MKHVTQWAEEVLDMAFEIKCLRHEVLRLQAVEARYTEFLNNSINHNDCVMADLLTVVATPGVLEAMAKDK